MSTRRNFRGIANGLLSAFVSRNNDVNGFWGIGKLYSTMVARGWKTVQINFRTCHMNPPAKEFDGMIRKYSDLLFLNMESAGLNDVQLKNAVIELTAYPNEPEPHFETIAPHRVFCRLRITDDRDRTYMCEISTWCREHNPDQEGKSTRTDEQ